MSEALLHHFDRQVEKARQLLVAKLASYRGLETLYAAAAVCNKRPVEQALCLMAKHIASLYGKSGNVSEEVYLDLHNYLVIISYLRAGYDTEDDGYPD